MLSFVPMPSQYLRDCKTIMLCTSFYIVYVNHLDNAVQPSRCLSDHLCQILLLTTASISRAGNCNYLVSYKSEKDPRNNILQKLHNSVRQHFLVILRA